VEIEGKDTQPPSNFYTPQFRLSQFLNSRRFNYNDRRFRHPCAFSTSSLIRRIFSKLERRASSQAESMFFKCSTRFAFATVASSDSQTQDRSPWFVRSES
jgi:hypothetical protein